MATYDATLGTCCVKVYKKSTLLRTHSKIFTDQRPICNVHVRANVCVKSLCVCVFIPRWLQRGPPAGRWGCVHLWGLHTGLWCASSPEREKYLSISIIYFDQLHSYVNVYELLCQNPERDKMNKGEKPRSGYRTNCKSKRVLEKVKLYEPISIAYPQMSTLLQQQLP